MLPRAALPHPPQDCPAVPRPKPPAPSGPAGGPAAGNRSLPATSRRGVAAGTPGLGTFPARPGTNTTPVSGKSFLFFFQARVGQQWWDQEGWLCTGNPDCVTVCPWLCEVTGDAWVTWAVPIHTAGLMDGRGRQGCQAAAGVRTGSDSHGVGAGDRGPHSFFPQTKPSAPRLRLPGLLEKSAITKYVRTGARGKQRPSSGDPSLSLPRATAVERLQGLARL